MTDARNTLDPRRHAYRADLADVRLRGRVTAQRFVTGVAHRVRWPVAAMRRAPDMTLALENEALFGESIAVYDAGGDWAWGQRDHDGYVGYMPAAALTADSAAPTHRVKVPGTFVYPEPNIKRPPLAALSLNACLTVAVAAPDERFVTLATGGYVFARHVCPIAIYARDYVEVAERMIHTPYLWGGRTRLGLDCSGLVQLALEAAGLACPRDTDMAVAEVGEPVLVPADLEGLERGDLVYWPGHCGLMIDSVMLLHANAHHMATVIEPLSQVVRRSRKSGAGPGLPGPDIAAIKRLPAPTAQVSLRSSTS